MAKERVKVSVPSTGDEFHIEHNFGRDIWESIDIYGADRCHTAVRNYVIRTMRIMAARKRKEGLAVADIQRWANDYRPRTWAKVGDTESEAHKWARRYAEADVETKKQMAGILRAFLRQTPEPEGLQEVV